MSVGKDRPELRLTHRAVRDIAEIEVFSTDHWGKETAAKYISDLEAALLRLSEKPGLLRSEVDLHPVLQFYRVNKHVLVCDVQQHAIIVLTVIHANRDIPARLAELAPTLADEVELLHKQLRRLSD